MIVLMRFRRHDIIPVRGLIRSGILRLQHETHVLQVTNAAEADWQPGYGSLARYSFLHRWASLDEVRAKRWIHAGISHPGWML